MTAALHFLAWAREGLVAGETAADPLTDDIPARGPVRLGVTLTGRAEAGFDLRLYGPGDVRGLDARQVIRTDPPAGSSDFEPNNFPVVEFDRPDFPWLFTPAAAGDRGRLRPWLCLVVTPVAASTVHTDLGGPLPVLECALDDLPDLGESWAWAHAQVATAAEDEDLTTVLATRPERTLSRLVCPRRLLVGVAYRACVVPTFEAGRLAGLGLPVDDDAPYGPAWTAGSGAAPPLPVYYGWEFRTGADGDFEALVRRLRSRALGPGVGLRAMEVGPAGVPGLDPHVPVVSLGLEGALRGAKTMPSDWPAASRDAFRTRLRALIADTSTTLGPPLYGGRHAGRTTVPSDSETPHWLRDLNLDPRHRVAAALGVRVVQDQQEALMAAAWEQAAEVQRANEILRQAQLAGEVGRSAYGRRFALPATTGTQSAGSPPLGVGRLLQVSRPVLGQVTVSPRSQRLVDGELGRNVTADATLSTTFRRLTRAEGPLARRFRAANAAIDAPVEAAAATTATATPVPVPPRGTVLFDSVSGDESFKRITPGLIDAAIAADPWWRGRTGAGPTAAPVAAPATVDPAPTQVLTPPGAATDGRRVWVGTTDGRLFELFFDDTRWLWFDHGRPPGFSVGPVAPGAMMDGGLRCFVATIGGPLMERYWDGDRWQWQNHGVPPDTWTLGSSPGAVINNTSLFCLTAVSGTPTDGTLFERRRNGTQWTWVQHGRPNNEVIVTNPVALTNTRIFVGTQPGKLWERRLAKGAWNWVDHGAPPGLLSDLGPAVGDGKIFALTRAGRLFERYLSPSTGSTGAWVDHGTPPGVALSGNTPGGGLLGSMLFAVDSNLHLQQRVWEGSAWAWHDLGLPPGTTVMQPPGGEMPSRTQVFVAGSNGHLFSVRSTGSGWVWEDHGAPADARGAGDYAAEPAPSPRWALPLGFLSNVVVAHVDNPSGENQLYHRVGRDVGFDGEVRGGWTDPVAKPGTTGAETQGVGVAVVDVNGSGLLDLILLWIEEQAGFNTVNYQVGWNLDANGVVTGGWAPRRVAGAYVADQIQGADLALADLDGDGRLELIIAYATGGPAPKLFYRVGWRLDETGQASRGWSDSVEVPWPTAGTVQGVGVAVADLNDDTIPDIAILTVEPRGDTCQAWYRIGRKLNARGRVVGDWSAARVVGGGDLGPTHQGAGLAAIDVTGTRRADLVFFHVENPAGENHGYYRVGWDLDPDGVAQRWTASRPVPGWFGGENQGTAVTIADVNANLTAIRTTMGDNFSAAASRHQAKVIAAQSLTSQSRPTTVDISAMASRVRTALEPVGAVTERALQRIDASALPGKLDSLRQIAVVPQFPRPMYEALRDLSQDLLFPRVSDVPPETATLLRVNAPFVEAFMVGLNSEMSRELLWRRYPTDLRATYFRQFWDVRGAVASVGPLPDIPPIAEWRADRDLGDNATAVGTGEMVVLLIRGEVLRRYPGTAVYAQRAQLSGGARVLGDEIREPQFGGRLDPDLVFFGLPLTVAEARGSAADPGWFIVLRQPPTQTRFGLDEPEAVDFGHAPSTWTDVSWGHVARSPAELGRLTHVLATGPLATLRRGALEWGYNGAHMAQILLQRPVLVALHASDLLPPVDDTWRVTAVARRSGGVARHRIVALGGTRGDGTAWRMTTDEVLAAIARHERFIVEQPAGDRVAVFASRTKAGRRYLKTSGDGDRPNNLLSLPELPEEAQ